MQKFFLFTILIFLLPSVVQAHQVKSDNNVSVILHIEPGDSPIVGQEAKIFFEVKTPENNFAIEDCSCHVSIRLAQATIADQEATEQADEGSEHVFSLPAVFPERGIYRIEITGASRNNLFSDFAVGYDVRIDRGAAASTHSSHGMENTWQYQLHRFGLYACIVALTALGGIIIVKYP